MQQRNGHCVDYLVSIAIHGLLLPTRQDSEFPQFVYSMWVRGIDIVGVVLATGMHEWCSASIARPVLTAVGVHESDLLRA